MDILKFLFNPKNYILYDSEMNFKMLKVLFAIFSLLLFIEIVEKRLPSFGEILLTLLYFILSTFQNDKRTKRMQFRNATLLR